MVAARQQQQVAENGEIMAAAVIDGIEAEATVKTLQRANGPPMADALIPGYAPIPGDNAILGKVVAVLCRI
jgi:SOS-response transcriptional repressor LexA